MSAANCPPSGSPTSLLAPAPTTKTVGLLIMRFLPKCAESIWLHPEHFSACGPDGPRFARGKAAHGHFPCLQPELDQAADRLTLFATDPGGEFMLCLVRSP